MYVLTVWWGQDKYSYDGALSLESHVCKQIPFNMENVVMKYSAYRESVPFQLIQISNVDTKTGNVSVESRTIYGTLKKQVVFNADKDNSSKEKSKKPKDTPLPQAADAMPQVAQWVNNNVQVVAGLGAAQPLFPEWIGEPQ